MSFSKYCEKNEINAINIIKVNKLKTLGKEDEENIGNNNKTNNINKDIDYNFSSTEIITNFLCPCLASGNLKIKNKYNDKATRFLYNKLDIILYIRNMILFDIMSEALLDEDKKNIINFLADLFYI